MSSESYLERKRRNAKTYRERNPDKVYETKIKCLYGITLEEYDKILASQNYQCAICGTDTPVRNRGRFDVDHNHTTGIVRGLLCSTCNRAIGLLKDSPALAFRAAEYLNQ